MIGSGKGGFIWLYLVFLVGLSILLTWPLATGLNRLVINAGDPFFLAWVLTWDCHALASNPLGLFHANIFYPHSWTLAFSEHSLGNALLVFPFWCAGAGPVLLHNLALLFTFLLCSLFMFLLVRQLTGNTKAAALAGVLYAFSHYRFGQLGNVPLLSMGGLPLFLLGLHLIVSHGAWRYFLLSGAGFLLLVLTGNYNTYMSIVAGLLFVIWFLVKQRGRIKCCLVRRALVTLFILAIVTAPLILPYVNVRNEYGFRRDRKEIEFYAAHPLSYMTVPAGNHWMGSITAKFARKEGVLFPGLIVLGLAGCAWIYPRKSINVPVRSYYAALVIIAGWCSLGLNPPGPVPSLYAVLHSSLPGFDGMRVPARFGMLVTTALTVLAGFGAAALLDRLRLRSARMVTVALLLLAVAEVWCVPLNFREGPTKPDEVNQWLAGQPGDAPVLFLPVFTQTRSYYEARRMLSATAHWRPLVNGYSGFTPPGYEDLAARLNRFPDAESLALLKEMGVQFVVNEWEYYEAEERTAILAQKPVSVVSAAEFPEATIWDVSGSP